MEELITSLGFPIACCVALGVYVTKQNTQIREDNKEDKELWMLELQYSREVNSKLLASNEIMAKDISAKLDKVLVKVGE